MKIIINYYLTKTRINLTKKLPQLLKYKNELMCAAVERCTLIPSSRNNDF